MVIAIILLIIGGLFVGYSLMTHYSSTPSDKSVFKRILMACSAAAAAIGMALVQYIHSITGP